MHLTPEELIDLAEGARAEATAPHLQSCSACREQVAMLRTTLATAAGVDIPEPSPLFWDHLSRRVREAVDAEGSIEARSGAPWWSAPFSWRVWAMAGLAAAVIISLYTTAPWTSVSPSPTDQAVDAQPLEPFGAADDPSLVLFGDLTQQMDAEAITDFGWRSHLVGVDEVVVSLSHEERMELQRLLTEELAKS
jgi:hypothetical protein